MSKTTKGVVAPEKHARDADAWLKHGQIIYTAARTLFDDGNVYLYFSAATLGHTCLEVLMKGIFDSGRHGELRSEAE